MADSLFFRKGILADLMAKDASGNYTKAPIIPGSINITTDEPGIYLDLTENGINVRKRVGDIVQVDSIDKLVLDRKTMTGIATSAQGLVSEWSETAVYYALAENALLKYNKNEKTVQKDDGTTETIPANSWIQINTTSDIVKNIASLETRIKNNEDDIKELDNTIKNNVATKEELNTAKTDLTAAIGTAKTEAITAANEHTDAEIGRVETELELKAVKTEVAATVATLATKAELAEALEGLSAGDLADLKELVGLPKDPDNKDTPSGLHKAIADEIARATEAEENLDEKITTLGNNVASTYETKEEAAASHQSLTTAIAGNTTAIGNEKTRAEAKEEELAKAISDETTRATGVEAGLSKKITELENADKTFATKDELTAAIGKKSGPGADETGSGLMLEIENAQKAAATDATNKANTAESNAKSYADTELAKKLDTTAFNTKMGLPNDFSGTVYNYINNRDEATLQSAKDYADGILEASDAMVFKGVLGGDGNLTELPAAEATKGGDTYKIGKAGTYAGIECFVGDLLIAKDDNSSEYYHVSSGYEDDYDPVLTAVDADKKVILQDTVGDNRGSIQFISNANSNATVNMTSTVDPQTKIASTVVTIGMEWGSF